MSELRFIGVSLFVIVTLVLVILFPTESVADLWVKIDANSLVGFQALIEKNVDPDLWLTIVLPALRCPVWAITLVVSALLLLRRRRRQGGYSRFR